MEATSSLARLQDASRSQHMLVRIRIIEGKQFSGLKTEAVRVCVQVGDSKKYTSDKENTICPYYDETFIFEFCKPAAQLLDEVITLTVSRSKKILGIGLSLLQTETIVGIYNVDLKTVFAEPENQFYNKWCQLSDPNDITGQTRGLIKCDIRVICRGDNIKPPLKVIKFADEVDDKQMTPTEETYQSKLKARLIVKIYKADGLPKMTRSVTSIFKEAKDLVNPYVEVSFAGLEGKTSVKQCNYAPVWNEQIIFHEIFPSLCQSTIKIQLKEGDGDVLNNNVIGTHSIDLKKISIDGSNECLPTFGPTYIHLYGTTREYSMFNWTASLKEDLGEGIAYRGRLLVEVATEKLENSGAAPREARTTSTCPINESDYGKPEDFFLFCSILNATMMSRTLKDKLLFFEISIGNAGNTLDGHNPSRNSETIDESDSLQTVVSTEIEASQSTTEPMKPMTHNGVNFFLPFRNEKPCMYIKSRWPDNRHRMYNSNLIMRLAENLEEGLAEVSRKMEEDQEGADSTLIQVLDNFITGCNKYVSAAESRSEINMSTKLDLNRMEMCYDEICSMGEKAARLKAVVTQHSLEEACKEVKACLHELKDMIEDPQDALPDVFLWLVVNNRRHAYQRISAKDLIFSMTQEECGKFCSKVHTRFFKLPGKKRIDPSSRWIQVKLDIYLWLGLSQHNEYFLNGYPEGYEISNQVENIQRPGFVSPLKIYYPEKHVFEFRAYMYQARSLIGSDRSGLSDPSARVFIGETSAETQVINQTLMPTWNEQLTVDNIFLYGPIEQIKREPPLIVIEMFDKDWMRESDFLGATSALPRVKLANEFRYPIPLKWFRIERGGKRAGELLAAFELLQKESFAEDFQSTEGENIQLSTSVSPIPKNIRPTLANYRIEVLFWGLRNLKCFNWTNVKRPIVEIECAEKILSSSEIPNAQNNPNFDDLVKSIVLELPEEEIYRPPLTIRVVDRQKFINSTTLIGSHIINSVQKYICDPAMEFGKNCDNGVNDDLETSQLANNEVIIELAHDTTPQNKTPKKSTFSRKMNNKNRPDEDTENDEGDDWWSRYFASVESDAVQQDAAKPENQNDKKKKIVKFKVYSNELEVQPEFNSFQDWLLSFDLYRGKKIEEDVNDESRLIGTFKGSLKVYKLPILEDMEDIANFDAENRSHRDFPSNDNFPVLVRIYIVKAKDLHSIDSDGNANPYISVQLGSLTETSDYIPKQLNPEFGKCFEIKAVFPRDSMLTIQVLNKKLIERVSDNLIGETKIDLENRFYSRHRAHCGLSKKYEITGTNKWRDTMKPTEILTELCRNSKLEPPSYENGSVKVGYTRFKIQNIDKFEDAEEQMALDVLHHWNQVEPRVGCNLVPEHIEIRPLYKPGKIIERGKLEMWVDMFPIDRPMHLLGPQIDISPRKPKPYVLRVIIWNTSDVKLQERAFFTGEKMSDIFVKGWVNGPEESQRTDIHYRSLTGEGNFNWRFVFPFEYIAAEKKIVTSHKTSILSRDERESKLPPRLELQVLDSDLISANDYLGSLVLDLNNFPKGAKSAKLCKLKMLKTDGSVSMINIFKQKRVKGWWPFHVKKENGQMELTGKVELELHLLTQEEAGIIPVGLGRDGPNPLEKPNRPDWSFLWFLNMTKSAKHIIWRHYKWAVFKIIILIIIIHIILGFLSYIPAYVAKKLGI
ncbi:otoferlin-like [Planococcus citri]|uniref:otoferlin-like n=1 Tax=Planococcus citri TaxID=170843 RepID=UPI0031F82916